MDSLYDIQLNSVQNYAACYSTSLTPWPLEGSSLDLDATLKLPLDDLYAEDGSGRRKPGPRPKGKKTKREAIL